MQEYGVNYWDTYSPVVSWMTVRTMLTLSILQRMHTRAIDFTLAFPQADVKVPIYMDVPIGFTIDAPGVWVLELKKNVYALKDASKTWFDYLTEGLTSPALGFKQSQTDLSLFFNEQTGAITSF